VVNGVVLRKLLTKFRENAPKRFYDLIVAKKRRRVLLDEGAATRER
jgi:hypothetical protein